MKGHFAEPGISPPGRVDIVCHVSSMIDIASCHSLCHTSQELFGADDILYETVNTAWTWVEPADG